MSKKVDVWKYVDDHVLERYVQVENDLDIKKKDQKQSWKRWSAVAAVIGLVIGGWLLGGVLQGEVPKYWNATYTAEEIAQMRYFGATNAVTTNAYEKVCTASADFLNIHKVPEQKTLPIYRYENSKVPINTREFEEVARGMMEKVADAIELPLPEYEINIDEVLGEQRVGVSTYFDEHMRVGIKQYEKYYYYQIEKVDTEDYNEKIYLDGNLLQVDQRLSDEEILTSLEPVKKRLCEIFDITVDAAKVVRKYNERKEYGVTELYVYFYVNGSLVEGEDRYLSDHIEICFDGDNSILCDSSIRCIKYREKEDVRYQVVDVQRRISIEEAEKLLYKGYVFGGHSCPTCMTMQGAVSFENYDFVGLEYLYDWETEPEYRRTIGIPFYVFYKDIGTAENGNQIYAKTYVPAIEVSGLKEYFEAQKKEHKSK